MDKQAGKGEIIPTYIPPRVIKIGTLKNGEGDFGIESTCSPSGSIHNDTCINTGSGAEGCVTGGTYNPKTLSGSPSYSYGDVAFDANGDAI